MKLDKKYISLCEALMSWRNFNINKQFSFVWLKNTEKQPSNTVTRSGSTAVIALAADVSSQSFKLFFHKTELHHLSFHHNTTQICVNLNLSHTEIDKFISILQIMSETM